MITIRIPRQLRGFAKEQDTISTESGTVGEVFSGLKPLYPELIERILNDDGSFHRFINVYVNDDDVRYLGGLEAAVEDGATMSLLPAVAGG
jgi:molybdopterin converting factor small subunit